MNRLIFAASLLGLVGCESGGSGTQEVAGAVQQPIVRAGVDQSESGQEQSIQSVAYNGEEDTGLGEIQKVSVNAVGERETTTAFVPEGVALDVFGKDEAKPVRLAHSKNMVGSWTVYLNSDDRVCQLDLGEAPKSNGYQARANNCMDGDLFFVSNWGLKGQELVLFDDLSRLKGRMRRTEKNRWEGLLASNGKPILIAR
ncbi:Protease inhibitor Inh [Pseudovibrio axinellae]|uniref:Protease inhibitor Inh n=1 Tax=Pseudovibrio axinellae TaxID=989403 RepID=A0A161XH99_9HYPH|nr:AprI/Inh family metalloprotease inhibitor [Pseudovibrio axinellae]KZL21283.1 Protease inhibitor Inh [Pseudovibrio axinellae]SEQ94695.1 Protease inhibitor Inh [Pseudovibrio axinellae]